MESDQLLRTIYEISKQDPNPETYPCKPRDLILRFMQDWAIIQSWLQALEKENLVTTVQKDTLIISITKQGIEKASALNFFVKENE